MTPEYFKRLLIIIPIRTLTGSLSKMKAGMVQNPANAVEAKLYSDYFRHRFERQAQ
jgi:hypothetical protein